MAKVPDLALVRNIGIAAHVDAGKTTLTERMLYYAGVSYKIGEVHEGAAHMDYMVEEQVHGITITAAVTRLPWREHLIQLIDTPGHVDFTIEVERSMRVLDGCVIVLDGVRGVEPQTETVWRQRSKFRLPVLFFVNKLDRPGADFGRALATVRERLHAEPVAVTVPLPDPDGTVVHLIEKTRLRFTGERGEKVQVAPCDEATWERVRPWRESLLLAAAEMDDALAERVLAEEEPEPAAVWAALRQAVLAGKSCPCCAGAAAFSAHQGIQPLMDGVVAAAGSASNGRRVRRTGPTVAERVAMKPGGRRRRWRSRCRWEGRRRCVRPASTGELQSGDEVDACLNGAPRPERVARLFEVDANHRQAGRGHRGQIVLLAGLRWATTGDTLCAPSHPLWLSGSRPANRCWKVGEIEPQSGADEENCWRRWTSCGRRTRLARG
ncbi:MAG: GTP-binding protein [Candidatus Competibacteraceae bacterium]